MKKILVSGYIGFNNFGDEAIFYALVNHLKSLKFKVCALCNNPKDVKNKYDVDTFYYKNPIQIIKAIIDCDILYSGGGSLLQNKTGNFSLYYYLLIILTAKLFCKKVFIFSQGIEPVNGKFSEFFLKFVLKQADYITVRDNNSLNYLKTLNINSDLTSDPVYSLVENYKISSEKKGLIVQLRDFKDFNKNIPADLAYSLKGYKDTVRVLSLQNEVDEKICKTLVEKLNSEGVKARYTPFYSIEKTFDIINQAEFMISTRLHGAILANALKVKTFALIYDDKVRSLADEFKIQNVDLKNYTQNELDKKLKKFFKSEVSDIPYRKFDWSLTDMKLLKRK